MRMNVTTARRYLQIFALLILFAPQFLSSQFSQQSTAISARTHPAKSKQPKPKSNCTNNGTYRNRKGEIVRRPENCSAAPEGATAQCRDGTYSFSRSRRGTCSYHGGVAK